MDATKLMLGNLFVETKTFRDGLGEVIEIIELKKLNNEICFTGDFPAGWQASPIKIKESILIQLGVKKDGPMRYIGDFKFFYSEWYGYHYWNHRNHKISSKEPIKLEFIHELQKAYFYFKGEHLKHSLTGMIIPV